jgi:hypothetical protein
MWDGQHCELVNGPEVDAHHAVELLHRSLLDPTRLQHAGAVHLEVQLFFF